MKPDDLHWLSGLLEGEGTFYVHRSKQKAEKYLVIEINMIDEDVISRVASLFDGKYTLHFPPSRRKAGHQKQYRARLIGKKANAFIVDLEPLLSERRKVQIKLCKDMLS